MLSRRLSSPLPLFAFLLLSLTAGCGQEPATGWQGYAEGDYLYVAAPFSGRLQELPVQKGGEVAAGALLFRLDPEPEASALALAQMHLVEAESRRDDLAVGERPSEVAALRARRKQTLAAVELAQSELERHAKLLPGGGVSQELFDRSRTTLRQRQAELAEVDARLVTAGLGGRTDQRRALDATVAAASAALHLAEWNLAQKSPTAAGAALVFDTLFEPGELVAAGTPVVVLLPPGGRKARFFVAEAQLASLHPGGKVKLRFDGGELAATISYISPQAEFTPPVIYSRETRGKLVYLVEARPEPSAAEQLKPGQPLEVFAE